MLPSGYPSHGAEGKSTGAGTEVPFPSINCLPSVMPGSLAADTKVRPRWPVFQHGRPPSSESLEVSGRTWCRVRGFPSAGHVGCGSQEGEQPITCCVTPTWEAGHLRHGEHSTNCDTVPVIPSGSQGHCKEGKRGHASSVGPWAPLTHHFPAPEGHPPVSPSSPPSSMGATCRVATDLLHADFGTALSGFVMSPLP